MLHLRKRWHQEVLIVKSINDNQLIVHYFQVVRYMHTITLYRSYQKPSTKIYTLRIRFGIGSSNTNQLKTLDTLLRDNGHSHKTINYLKVFRASLTSQFTLYIKQIPSRWMLKVQSGNQWCNGLRGGTRHISNKKLRHRNYCKLTILLSSGSLANVRQIGIEFHNVPKFSKQYFTIIQELYKLGFVTIMWDENRVANIFNKGSPLFEIVFRRSNLTACVL